MIRSLIAKAYLWALMTVILAGLAGLGLARWLLEAGELDGVRRFGLQHARFIATELERTATATGPLPARMRELGPPLHATLAWVPWDQPARYPAGLRHVKLYFAPEPWPGPSWRVYWIRLDRRGRPLGALRVAFVPPVAARPGGPALGIGLWVVGLGLLVVPPLVFWVILPLRRMVRIADRLGSGDLDTPVPVTRRDEVGQLEAAFEGLRGRLARMIAQREALLRDVSHELRGPLSRMSVALPLARLRPDGPYLDKLQAEVDAMDALIGEILDLARARNDEAYQPGPLDLAELVREAVAARELTASSRGLALTHDLAPAPGTGDARLLARAVGNLLDNALKYTPAGGTVHVETRPGLVRVTDDGPGIAPGDLVHVFEPFWRPDGSRARGTGGTGVGLAIVKAVAERHGGAATLAAGPSGRGTVASLTLP